MGGTHRVARRTAAEVGLAGRVGLSTAAPVGSCLRDPVHSRTRFDSSLAVAASCLGASAAPFLRALASGGRGAAEQCTGWAGLLGGRRWRHLAAHEARSRSRPARARRARARLLLRASACPARRPVAHPHSSPPRPRHRTLVGRAHPCHGKNGTQNELAGAVSAGHARAHQPRLKFGLSRRCSIDAALLRTEPRRHEARSPSRISPLSRVVTSAAPSRNGCQRAHIGSMLGSPLRA